MKDWNVLPDSHVHPDWTHFLLLPLLTVAASSSNSFCLSSAPVHSAWQTSRVNVLILLFQLVYTEMVMENSPSSMFVLKVSASDADMGANGHISFTLHGPDTDKFYLDQNTGMTLVCLGSSSGTSSPSNTIYVKTYLLHLLKASFMLTVSR